MRDELFIRGRVPMTKAEVRAISLAKLELDCSGVLWDIGAGTGSISIEAAMQLKNGRVYAIEKNREGCELIRANSVKFNINNLNIIEGVVPACLYTAQLPRPDYAFIGGSSGHLSGILDELLKLNTKVRIVVNIITLESLAEITQWLSRQPLEAEIVSVQVAHAKVAGDYHLMEGSNPVYVITMGGQRGERRC